MKSLSKKIIFFHPTIAPYRIDFFNDLFAAYHSEIYLYYKNLKSQNFDYDIISEKLKFEPHYMKKFFSVGKRDFYKGHISTILKNKADIVIVGEYNLGAWFAVIARLFSKKKYKIVSICDDSKKIAEDCSGLRKFSRAVLLKQLNGLILCNENASEWYTENYCIKNIVFPIIHDDQVFRKRLASGKSYTNDLVQKNELIGKKVFLFVGRLSKEKNLPYLIKSFHKAHEQNNDIILLLVGGDNSVEQTNKLNLESLINKYNANEYIKLVGRKEGDQLSAYYLVGQVFLLPSIFEAFGAVTNEALLAGENVMISKNAGSACLVTDKNGEIIDIDEPEIDFTSMINKINPFDGNVVIRESKMPYTYKEKMSNLIKWLDEI